MTTSRNSILCTKSGAKVAIGTFQALQVVVSHNPLDGPTFKSYVLQWMYVSSLLFCRTLNFFNGHDGCVHGNGHCKWALSGMVGSVVNIVNTSVILIL